MGLLDLPAAYMSGYDSMVFPDRPRPLGRGRRWGLPVLAHAVSTHAQGLRLRGVAGQLALIAVLETMRTQSPFNSVMAVFSVSEGFQNTLQLEPKCG